MVQDQALSWTTRHLFSAEDDFFGPLETRHISLTFANALRSFPPQDPDIVMIGEIRDQ